MNTDPERLQKLIKDIEALGYSTGYGSSNPSAPNQQLWVYKNGQLRAKVSLMLANRVNTMFNGIGRNDQPLLELLVNFSTSL
ncbi:hypothetical protein [Lacticaseibacillus paracasei]|uniref:Uncharacterized protein n=1 Tax=Lacticaseibacillus paracasei subsp. paracasei Lpp126 TaxID=1256206 RepID=S2QY15_LACPA|nr:hypothetical protein Lpp126_16339 [Lacticaseibacillus paracasei subsp. paracasei Lpp126]